MCSVQYMYSLFEQPGFYWTGGEQSFASTCKFRSESSNWLGKKTLAKDYRQLHNTLCVSWVTGIMYTN